MAVFRTLSCFFVVFSLVFLKRSFASVSSNYKRLWSRCENVILLISTVVFFNVLFNVYLFLVSHSFACLELFCVFLVCVCGLQLCICVSTKDAVFCGKFFWLIIVAVLFLLAKSIDLASSASWSAVIAAYALFPFWNIAFSRKACFDLVFFIASEGRFSKSCYACDKQELKTKFRLFNKLDHKMTYITW